MSTIMQCLIHSFEDVCSLPFIFKIHYSLITTPSRLVIQMKSLKWTKEVLKMSAASHFLVILLRTPSSCRMVKQFGFCINEVLKRVLSAKGMGKVNGSQRERSRVLYLLAHDVQSYRLHRQSIGLSLREVHNKKYLNFQPNSSTYRITTLLHPTLGFCH